MLICYPIAATQENWLHEALVSMIHSLHAQLDAGNCVPENQASWVNFVEVCLQEPQRAPIVRATGIRDRFFAYKRAVEQLLPLERQNIVGVMAAQNQIAELLAGHQQIDTIENFADVNNAVHDLFVFCYEKLTDLKVRKRQYELIYNFLEEKICPFCGIHRVLHADETAQDQDHYLAKSIYPFAAANMENLVPMCISCNRNIKRATDIIRDERGNRRVAFNPYNCVPPQISLVNSKIDDPSSPPKPAWNIEFIPNNQEAETWDAVFQIRTRYKRDILGNDFDRWLRGFINKCKRDRERGFIRNDFTANEIRDHLFYYCQDKSDSPSTGNAGFLEPLAFEFLLAQYDSGNQRIVQLIRDAVLGVQIEEAA